MSICPVSAVVQYDPRATHEARPEIFAFRLNPGKDFKVYSEDGNDSHHHHMGSIDR